MPSNHNLPPLREVVKKHGLSAQKSLGQNFLFDEQLLDRIADIPGDIEGQTVFEVGPGPGGLTRALLKKGAHVIAVEQDERCLPALTELADHYSSRLSITHGDAMKHEPAALSAQPYHIASNLPYNVGSALLVRWLSAETWPPPWLSLTLMFQKEVADRIVARPGSAAYGRLSILAQWRSDAMLAMKVHRSAFTPPPKIMSAVVHITPKVQPQADRSTLSHITQMAFGQRRKMLRQSLKKMTGALDALSDLGIDATRRPETLSVEEFVALAHAIGPSQPQS